jgi:signal transduction histidine kinase
MIQLMREYLDAEQPGPETFSSALAPAMRSVIEELSSIAAVRSIQLRLVGTCTATLPVPEARLRLALQYLIAAMVEAQPAGGKVMLLLGEGPAGTVLRVEGERGQTEREPARTASATTLRRVRLAIASRVLETGGAMVVFGEGDGNLAGFVLRIPRRVGASAR